MTDNHQPNKHETTAIQKLSVVLPVYNEYNNLESLISEITAVLPSLVLRWEIIAVNDGSTDGSTEMLYTLQERHANLKVVEHQSNRGYGAALRSGFFAAQYDYIFFMDSDGQFHIDDIRRFLPHAGYDSIVIGFRQERKDNVARKINGALWSLLICLLFRLRIRDLNCAYKLFPRTLLRDTALYAQGAFINAELLYWTTKHHYRIIELPVTHYARHIGKQTGANLLVIWKAFSELVSFYRRGQ